MVLDSKSLAVKEWTYRGSALINKTKLIAIMLAGMVISGGAEAQTKAAPQSQTLENVPFKVVVLNLEAIRRQAKAVRDIRDQIGEFRKTFQVEIQKEEEALRTANQELAKKRTILAPDAFAQERRQFEQRVVEVQRMVQGKKQSLDKVQADAMLKVEKKLNEIITTFAREKNISLVLRRTQTILVARAFEVTGEVLEQLDAQLAKVKVEKPGTK